MNKNNTLKYQYIFNILLKDIKNGKLQPHEKLLPEEKLAQKYNVSRVTVRNALDSLEELGYITRFRGRGTFVRAKVMEKKMSNVISFTQSNQMVGNIPSSKVLGLRQIKAPLAAINYLGIDEDDDIWEVKRIRFSNNLAVLYEESYWVDRICGEITMQNAQNSILSALSERGVDPCYVKQEFVALGATSNVAKNLEVPENFPVLRSTMSFYGDSDEAIFFSINYYRTDRITVTSTRYLHN